MTDPDTFDIFDELYKFKNRKPEIDPSQSKINQQKGWEKHKILTKEELDFKLKLKKFWDKYKGK